MLVYWETPLLPLRKDHFWVFMNSKYSWDPPAWGLKSLKCCLRCLRTSHGLPWERSTLSSIDCSLELPYSDEVKCSWLSSHISWLGQMNQLKRNMFFWDNSLINMESINLRPSSFWHMLKCHQVSSLRLPIWVSSFSTELLNSFRSEDISSKVLRMMLRKMIAEHISLALQSRTYQECV